MADETSADDSFSLYDLRVEAVCPPDEPIYCGAKDGDHFILQGEMLYVPPGQGFSIYSLAAVLPLLAAKQRTTHPNDWMSTDALVACPDPNCKSKLRIVRLERRDFSHQDTTAVPLSGHSRGAKCLRCNGQEVVRCSDGAVKGLST